MTAALRLVAPADEPPARAVPQTIAELCEHAQQWADEYYRCEGRPTGAARNMEQALRHLIEIAGTKPLDFINAELLYRCRESMLESGLCRHTINDRLRRIKHMLRWASKPPQRWLTVAQVADAALCESFKQWRSKAGETDGVKPVPAKLVKQTAAAAPPWLSVAIRLQWYTGMRPGEVAAMRRSELKIHRIKATGEAFLIYAPRLHKTAHRGRKREIVFGPRGEKILRAWLICCKDDKLFPVRDAPAYRQAIRRLNIEQGIEHWHPNQIRHSYATRVAAAATGGPDGARAVLGHSTVDTTTLYIEKNRKQAIEMQRLHG